MVPIVKKEFNSSVQIVLKNLIQLFDQFYTYVRTEILFLKKLLNGGNILLQFRRDTSFQRVFL